MNEPVSAEQAQTMEAIITDLTAIRPTRADAEPGLPRIPENAIPIGPLCHAWHENGYWQLHRLDDGLEATDFYLTDDEAAAFARLIGRGRQPDRRG